MNHQETKAYSIASFCRAYEIGRTSAYKEIKAGRLKITKVGKRSLIGVQDADHWFQQNAADDSTGA